MELRALAEQILFNPSLEVKLACPDQLTDESPGSAILSDLMPARESALRFSQQRAASSFPALHTLESDKTRARVLHFFANHELLATELMALVILKFPDAPKAFRRGILRTLRDEQEHTRLYVRRLAELGVDFGEFPVNGYFWKMIAPMATPMDYVSRLSLTFEQANLDYSKFFASRFELIGDTSSQALMEQIYRDEMAHVGYGLKWFRRWKDPAMSDWEAFEGQLTFPLSPQRAKGSPFNRQGREQLGMEDDFIQRLYVYSKSKGRTPSIFYFNPYAEQFMMAGKGFTPNRQQRAIQEDLETLPCFLSRSEDVVLLNRQPRLAYLVELKDAGFSLPQTECLDQGVLRPNAELRERKLDSLRPWAWSPCGWHPMKSLMAQASHSHAPVGAAWDSQIRPLFGKDWSAKRLGAFLEQMGEENWLAPSEAVGRCLSEEGEILDHIESLREAGYQRSVIKSLYGSAGGNMLRCWESSVDTRQRGWIRNALAREGALLVEPWLDRLIDFSVQWEVTQEMIRPMGWSHLLVDARGHYHGSLWLPSFLRGMPDELAQFAHQGEADRLKRVFENLRDYLWPWIQASGFTGPMGIDAAIYRDPSGIMRLKPMIEINPRYTMGRLALELARQHAPGSAGLLQILSLPQLRQSNQPSFAAWASQLQASHPIRRDERERLVQGMVCLNDPVQATGCLAIWQASPDLSAFWQPSPHPQLKQLQRKVAAPH